MIFCYDKRTVYQNYRTASEQSGTGEACDESESYADSTGILRVSALSFHAVYGQKSVALAGDTRSAVSFVGLSVVRKIINAPRPYEKFDMSPVLEKDTKGKSFPSRHVFSVFIIAMTIFYEHSGAGVLLGIIGLLLGIVRVLVGVHEPKDIIVGALAGIVCGIVGYYVI